MKGATTGGVSQWRLFILSLVIAVQATFMRSIACLPLLLAACAALPPASPSIDVPVIWLTEAQGPAPAIASGPDEVRLRRAIDFAAHHVRPVQASDILGRPLALVDAVHRDGPCTAMTLHPRIGEPTVLRACPDRPGWRIQPS